MTTCALCLENKKLCDSHIFPEYMYKHCYDNEHSYIEFNAEAGNYNKRRRKGIYEKLLCRECESIIQKYEDYAKHIIYDLAKPYIYESKSQFFLKDYDYNQFKLFLLSLIWRASVSTQETFKNVSLGSYEEKLRNIILTGAKTAVDEFPSLIYQTFIDEHPADSVFMEMYPGKAKADRKTIYQFIADGLYFMVGIGKCSIRTFPNGSSISPESLRIACDDLTKLNVFLDLYVRLNKQGKFSIYES